MWPELEKLTSTQAVPAAAANNDKANASPKAKDKSEADDEIVVKKEFQLSTGQNDEPLFAPPTKAMLKAARDARFTDFVVESYRKHASDRRFILIFCATLKSVKAIVDCFRSKGFKADSVSSKTPDDKRKKTFEAFRKGALAILVNCFLLAEVIDVPKVRRRAYRAVTMTEDQSADEIRLTPSSSPGHVSRSICGVRWYGRSALPPPRSRSSLTPADWTRIEDVRRDRQDRLPRRILFRWVVQAHSRRETEAGLSHPITRSVWSECDAIAQEAVVDRESTVRMGDEDGVVYSMLRVDTPDVDGLFMMYYKAMETAGFAVLEYSSLRGLNQYNAKASKAESIRYITADSVTHGARASWPGR